MCVGVYDAMEVGDIDLTFRGMKVAVYVGLGISYYWTLHVFLVSQWMCVFVLLVKS